MKCEQSPRKVRFATGVEMKTAVERQREFLYWLSFLISGDETSAEESVVDAGAFSSAGGTVFFEWLERWTSHATARFAVGRIRDLIPVWTKAYDGYLCPHSGHEVLTEEQVATLRRFDPLRMIVALDPLARSVLVLRGILRQSIYECALMLNVPRGAVVGAYCKAIQWIGECANMPS